MSFEDMMKELQKEYIENLPNKIDLIEGLHTTVDRKGLESAFHKIKGTGKTYGVPELSILAKVVERICKEDKNLNEIIPISISLLKKIESSRKEGQEFMIETDQEYIEIKKLAA